LVHFLQMNIELLVSDTYAAAVTGTKSVPSGRQEHEQWRGLTTPVGEPPVSPLIRALGNTCRRRSDHITDLPMNCTKCVWLRPDPLGALPSRYKGEGREEKGRKGLEILGREGRGCKGRT